MARAHYVTYAHDGEGRPISGVSVEVRLPGVATLISQTLYANDTPDMTTKANPFTGNADGKIEAFVDTPQVVDFYITKAGYDPITIRGTFQQLTASTLVFEDGGTPVAQRANIDFQDGFVLTDNAGANQTEIDADYAGTAELVDADHAAEGAGTSTKVARGDHKHSIPSAAAGASAPGDTAQAGTASTSARSDHRHSREAYGAAAQLADVDAAAESAGTDASVARGDHKHAATVANPGASAPGDTVSGGAATSLSRSDHRHSREAYATVTELADVSHAAEAAGSSAAVARGDHKHGISVAGTAELANVAGTEAAGSSNTVPRGDHVHAHGGGYPGSHTDVVAHNDLFHKADFVLKTSDESVTSSTVIQDDNELVVGSFPATSIVLVELVIIYEAGQASGDLKWQLGIPSGATYSGMHHALAPGATATGEDLLRAILSANAPFDAGGLGAGNTRALKATIVVDYGAFAGDIQFAWAQNSSSATPTIVQAGSFILARELA